VVEHQIKSLSVNYFELFSNHSNLVHFISTRLGGYSLPPYASLNLAFHVKDNPQTVLKNRELLAATLAIPLLNFVTAQQVHQANVAIITESMRGNGSIDFETAIPATDAMVTNIPNICLMILTADCVPILLYDPKRKVIGIAHAGWKGTVKFIAQKMVKAMQDNFSCSPSDILVGIGPSIGPGCYEIGANVIIEFERMMPDKIDMILKKNPNDKRYLNLWASNSLQLSQIGIPEKNIEIAEICTRCHADKFYSARNDGIHTGRFGSGIMLK
jgi:YfiH family protein